MRRRILTILISVCMLSTTMVNHSFANQVNEEDKMSIIGMEEDEKIPEENAIGDSTKNIITDSAENKMQVIGEEDGSRSEEEIENIKNQEENCDGDINSCEEELLEENGLSENQIEAVDEATIDGKSEEERVRVQENIIDSSQEGEDEIASDVFLDSHEDDPVRGMLDKDDFETKEEWQEYLREHPEEYDTIMASPSPYSKVNTKAKFRYTVTGLPCANAIQKMYVKDKEIYVTQRYGKTTYLSRCEINEKTKVAVCKDFMTLQRFGHGQTLEYFEWNGKAYFWVACKPNTAYDADWSMQIGRISYEPNTVIDYTQICRLSTLNYANKTGIGLDGVKRVDAALSDDGSKLLIWVKSPNNAMQYSWYDASILNQILDERENEMVKYVSFLDNDRLRKACLGSIVQKSSSDWILPNDSFQGVEFADQASVFVVGGGVGESPKIAFMEKNGSKYNYVKLATVTNLGDMSTSEVEGIQLQEDCIYLGICNHNTKTTEQYIYSIYRNDIDTVKREHTWNSGKTKTTQTCTTDEVKQYTCNYCKSTKQEIIKKRTGHDYQYSSTNIATLEKNGYDTYLCANCGAEKKETIYSPAMLSLSTERYYYNGQKRHPKITVTDKNGTIISKDNYTVSYSEGCTEAGNYMAAVQFHGKYSGAMEKEFRIEKKSQTINASSFTKTMGNNAFSINAKLEKGDGKLSYKTSNAKIVTVSSNGKVTIKGVGKATITITAAETKAYKKATKTISITVNPKGVSLSSLKSTYRGNATVKWQKNTSVTGYQIQYSKKSDFTSSKITTRGDKNVTTKTITGLTRGARYYMRIRTYKKTASGERYYSTWSAKKTVVVKR